MHYIINLIKILLILEFKVSTEAGYNFICFKKIFLGAIWINLKYGFFKPEKNS